MSPSTAEQIEQARTERRLVRPRLLAAAGVLLLLAGIIAFMGIITAEALYPAGYSTSKSAISDLGGTEPPNSVVKQPSATIFDGVMMAAGLLVIAAAGCVGAGFGRVPAALFTGLTGLGMLGVGVFPGNHGTIHAVFAMVVFIAGGVAAILSQTVTSPPFSVVATILGIVSLATLALYMVLGDHSPMAGLGLGGVERWVAYPILIWVMSFGGYLMGRAR